MNQYSQDKSLGREALRQGEKGLALFYFQESKKYLQTYIRRNPDYHPSAMLYLEDELTKKINQLTKQGVEAQEADDGSERKSYLELLLEEAQAAQVRPRNLDEAQILLKIERKRVKKLSQELQKSLRSNRDQDVTEFRADLDQLVDRIIGLELEKNNARSGVHTMRMLLLENAETQEDPREQMRELFGQSSSGQEGSSQILLDEITELFLDFHEKQKENSE